MRLRRHFLVLAGMAIGLYAGAPMADPAPAVAAHDVAVDKNWPLLKKYCTECHNATDWAGGIAYDTMDPADIPSDAKTWEAVVSKLRGRMMPPPGKPQPDQSTVNSFVSWMEQDLDKANAANPDPGFVALHRLNRTEYARAVQDLLDLKIDAAALLPKDTKSDGFDNVANVLKVSPTFLDQYISAARTVSAAAIGNPKAAKSSAAYRAGAHDQTDHIEGLPLGTRGGMLAEHVFPADGDYEFNLNVFTGVGYLVGLDSPHTLVLTIDDQKVWQADVGGPKDLKAADQTGVDFVKELKDRFQHIQANVKAGPHDVGIAFVARSFAESDEMLAPYRPGGGMERIPRVSGVEIVGPINPVGVSETPSRRRIFKCHPANAAAEEPCAKQIFASLELHAFRRAVTEEDLQAPLKFYRMARQSGGFDAGIQNGLVAILASPKFLYRAEDTPPDLAPGDAYRISDFDLASRLSFFLWSEGPDDELLTAAANGKLHERPVLEAQVHRLLADPRSRSLVTNFAFQWLQVDGIDKIEPDPTLFPSFDEDLRVALHKEIELFVDSVFRQDRNVGELMTANWTYVNERLALHYGIPNVRGAFFRRVTLTDSHRFGLLGKGGILMSTSYGNRTAPVLRGAWILENITGTPPKAPRRTSRRFRRMWPAQPHSRSASAWNCIAQKRRAMRVTASWIRWACRWRTSMRSASGAIATGKRAIRSMRAAEMVTGQKLNGPEDLRKALMANPEQFVQTLTVKLMTFALGRTVEYHDMPVVREIVHAAARDDYRFSSLIMGIVESEPFQMTRPPSDKPAVQTAQVTLPH